MKSLTLVGHKAQLVLLLSCLRWSNSNRVEGEAICRRGRSLPTDSCGQVACRRHSGHEHGETYLPFYNTKIPSLRLDLPFADRTSQTLRKCHRSGSRYGVSVSSSSG